MRRLVAEIPKRGEWDRKRATRHVFRASYNILIFTCRETLSAYTQPLYYYDPSPKLKCRKERNTELVRAYQRTVFLTCLSYARRKKSSTKTAHNPPQPLRRWLQAVKGLTLTGWRREEGPKTQKVWFRQRLDGCKLWILGATRCTWSLFSVGEPWGSKKNSDMRCSASTLKLTSWRWVKVLVLVLYYCTLAYGSSGFLVRACLYPPRDKLYDNKIKEQKRSIRCLLLHPFVQRHHVKICRWKFRK